MNQIHAKCDSRAENQEKYSFVKLQNKFYKQI